MNEKFGFLSNFGGVKVDFKKKNAPVVTPKHGELTDNPPIRNNTILLTDDSDSDIEHKVRKTSLPARRQTRKFDGKPLLKPVVNRILESSSSSLLNIPDEDEVPKPQQSSQSLFDSEELKSRNSKAMSKAKARDTVIGSFSDEELCSQLDEMKVKEQTPRKSTKETLKDTVIGPFSDISLSDRVVKTVDRGKLRDTVIQSSSDESDEPAKKPPPQRQQPPKRKAPKPKVSLADTIIGFSESMSGLSLMPSQIPEEAQEQEVEGSENSEEHEVITIPDSEEEVSFSDQPPLQNSQDSFENCSSINPTEKGQEVIPAAQDRESDSTLNRFFNNPPSPGTSEVVVTHSVIQKYKEVAIVEVIKSSEANLSRDRFIEDAERADDDQQHFEIAETDESSDESPQETKDNSKSETVVNSKPESPPQTQTDSTQNQTLTQSMIKGNISFSANINISLKISMGDSSDSSSDDSDSNHSEYSPSSAESEESQPQNKARAETKAKERTPVQKSTPIQQERVTRARTSNKKTDSARKNKQAAATPGSGAKISKNLIENPMDAARNPDDFKTPTKSDEPIIDEDLEAILNSVYGDTWKTPQLLRSCKSKNTREDLRKSIYANNFETFVKSLPKDLESTRINAFDKRPKKPQAEVAKKKILHTPTSDKKESTKFRKPASSSKKTYRRTALPKRAARKYLAICDTDTESSDSSDSESWNPNDTWNASSDDEVEEEVRIRRRTIARETHKDDEIIFVPEETLIDRRKKLDDLLEKSEFKKPPVLGAPLAPKVSKKKLFTQLDYDDDPDLNNDVDKDGKENVPDEEVFIKNPFLLPPKASVIKDTPQKKITPAKRTPKSATPSTSVNTYKAFSFLKSLNVSSDAIYCDPEGLHYRTAYKSKKIELTERLFKLYNEKVFNGALADVPFKWNKKLLNTAGRCNNARRNGVRQSQLELSDKVLTSADRLRCTLIHEMCHAATWILQGENGHGATWKRWAAKANAIFPELPKISVCHNYTIEYRYTYQCVHCKAKYQTHSKSKKIENIRCSVCKSSIELFINKKDKNGDVVLTPVSKEVKGFPKFVQLKYKEFKKPTLSHKEVMQMLSQQFALLTTQEKQDL